VQGSVTQEQPADSEILTQQLYVNMPLEGQKDKVRKMLHRSFATHLLA